MIMRSDKLCSKANSKARRKNELGKLLLLCSLLICAFARSLLTEREKASSILIEVNGPEVKRDL